MPGERLSMRKIREFLRLRWEQHLPQRVDRAKPGAEPRVGERLPEPGPPRRSDLAAAGRVG